MLRQEHQEQERYYDEANLLSFLAWYSLEFQDETARTNIKNAFKANREVFEVPAEIQLLVQVNNLDLLSILNDEAPISTNSQIHSSPEKRKQGYEDRNISGFYSSGLTTFSSNDTVDIRVTSELVNDMQKKMVITDEHTFPKGKAF